MKLKKIMVVGLIVIWAMVSLVGCGQKSSDVSQQEQQNQSLMVYSGAGLRKPMDEIGNTFKKKFGVEINYTYAGSAQNVVQIELTEEGDAYIPGARHYIEVCQEKGLVKSMKTVAYHIPVIGVPKGNPAQITGLSDLTKSGVKVILGDERACAIGKVAQKLLERNNLIKAVEKNIVTKDATVNEIVVHTACDFAS